jgi:copper chaperone
MSRRGVLLVLGLVAAGLTILPNVPAAPSKEKTVTLEITGMMWGSCVDSVRSALESVKGVKEAKVSLENKEAVVTYDPDQVKVEDLIKAVKNSRGMSSYEAKVKKK